MECCALVLRTRTVVRGQSLKGPAGSLDIPPVTNRSEPPTHEAVAMKDGRRLGWWRRASKYVVPDWFTVTAGYVLAAIGAAVILMVPPDDVGDTGGALVMSYGLSFALAHHIRCRQKGVPMVALAILATVPGLSLAIVNQGRAQDVGVLGIALGGGLFAQAFTLWANNPPCGCQSCAPPPSMGPRED
jgi:hypothetical protein